MTLPPRRKRCSFGGEKGVWWRRKTSLAPSSTQTTSNSNPVTVLVDEVVEWDETLARPIVRRSVCENQVSSSSDDESDNQSTPFSSVKQSMQPSPVYRSHRKKIKTFGGRSRRPLSLLLSQENAWLPSSNQHPIEENTPIPFQHPEPVVTLDRVAETILSLPLVSGSGANPDSDSDPTFAPERNPCYHENVDVTQSGTPQRPTATSSIEQAQKYFAHLDASCRLLLDSSSSPTKHRSVVRTTRKIELSSPEFLEEYTKYAKASRDLGVSPLKKAEYAKSRRHFFRKAELFDGFVDS